MPKIIRQNDHAIWTQATFAEALADIDNPPKFDTGTGADQWERLRNTDLNSNREFYCNIGSYENVKKIMSEGWAEKAGSVRDIAKGFARKVPAAKVNRRVGVWADQGNDLDVNRALRGDFDTCWRATTKRASGRPILVDLVFAWGGHWRRTADEMFWSGAAALVATDVLQAAGYRVRLTASSVSHMPGCANDGQDYWLRNDIVVKDHGRPVDVSLISAVVHGGIFRTVGFRQVVHAPIKIHFGLGYHKPPQTVPQLAAIGAGFDSPGQIIMRDAYTREAAIEEINRIVEIIAGKK